MSTPISKLGIIQGTEVSGTSRDVLVVPTSDVYMLEYDATFDTRSVIREKPVIVIGTYKRLDNKVHVESIIAYNPTDAVPTAPASSLRHSVWDTVLQFIDQFK